MYLLEEHFVGVFYFSLPVEMEGMKWGNTNSYLFSQGRLLQWNVSILMSNGVYLILSITKKTSCLPQGVSFARCFISQTQQSLHMHLQLQISNRFLGTSVEGFFPSPIYAKLCWTHPRVLRALQTWAPGSSLYRTWALGLSQAGPSR